MMDAGVRAAFVASDATGFEITSYSSSPSGSLFDLPAGAKVTASTGSS